MKFAHLADCHVGGWRDPRMSELSLRAFSCAIDRSIELKVDFVLIAGDLFNTALPSFDKLKEVVLKLRLLSEHHIPVYLIPGSHDFSPSGKTMLDVLESAGLCVNVVKGSVTAEGKLRLHFTVDPKTGAKITGLLGRRGMLDRAYYEDLDREVLEQETGFKIFLFHTALSELKTEGFATMEAQPVSFLPCNFDYYAGGHVHIVARYTDARYKHIVYPGPLFPNSFSELEKLKGGGFYLYEDGDVRYVSLSFCPVSSFIFDCNGKDAAQIEALVLSEVAKHSLTDALVTLRFFGTLSSGYVSDINFSLLLSRIYEMGAHVVLKTTAGLSAPFFSEIKIENSDAHVLEQAMILEHIGQIPCPTLFEERTILDLISALSLEKNEGERANDYEQSIKKQAFSLLGISFE